ncbi:MAG: GntR family transcriptional regulator [Tabrizicola sp.]|uniref:GntR family transcriptional regulator n=1 Tax=Tabrizicola sp. TaxID=2005166 RepID=UPI002736B8E6|nr:GntR family transcriptional regulator [Tabrizicola sp.]MDP3263902.1 GntR family transcriptional regulator [Tabrizicola sp.]MDP3647266.1 GntR family transcriptional regulator [Paracoccaceae bacterium]MDZ4068601.1 GntR family transcriptional regulator [Tabrizicola sp.]
MDADNRKIPSHEVTYARLRDMVLYGHLEPGQPVTIQGLVADLGAGMTPVREAIRRLMAEGALLPQGNRRVAVPQLSADMLDQVAFARLAIEPKLAELAAPRLTGDRVDQLEAIDGAVNRAIDAGRLSDYLTANHAFHFAIYEAADAPVLYDMARSLWLRAGPSLRAVIARYGREVAPDLHREALAAMRNGDAKALAAAIERDIQQGVDHVRQALSEAA